jgi:hypothetical protein
MNFAKKHSLRACFLIVSLTACIKICSLLVKVSKVVTLESKLSGIEQPLLSIMLPQGNVTSEVSLPADVISSHNFSNTSSQLNMDGNSEKDKGIIEDNLVSIKFKEIMKYPNRRAHLINVPVDTNFVSDMEILKAQLNNNYVKGSECQPKNVNSKFKRCFGLGTSLTKLNKAMMSVVLNGYYFHDIDELTCDWFKRDKTKSCNTMFGDCYFPALMSKTVINQNQSCNNVNWFMKKYKYQGFWVAHFSWMMSQHSILSKTQPCIALHIRRGDACINVDRKCFDYDDYWRATKFLVDRFPELQRIVVVTDADDFPLTKFESLVAEVSFAKDVDRSKYNVHSLRNLSIQLWSPEFRDLQNATSELITEVNEASDCTALVGTLTAGVSKWILLNMMARQGKIPLFYSLEGCLKNVCQASDFDDSVCERPFL